MDKNESNFKLTKENGINNQDSSYINQNFNEMEIKNKV